MSENKEIVYWSLLQTENWSMYTAATDAGLCYVGSAGKPYEELAAWVKARMPGAVMEHNEGKLQSMNSQIMEYLNRERDRFTIKLDLRGTAFQQSVWKALTGIPHGVTCSYSDLAESIGRKSAARAVGAAVGANPALIVVPCHRVVGKSGALTGYRGGMAMKESLLQLEKKNRENLV